jgi:hypothetical protein
MKDTRFLCFGTDKTRMACANMQTGTACGAEAWILWTRRALEQCPGRMKRRQALGRRKEEIGQRLLESCRRLHGKRRKGAHHVGTTRQTIIGNKSQKGRYTRLLFWRGFIDLLPGFRPLYISITNHAFLAAPSTHLAHLPYIFREALLPGHHYSPFIPAWSRQTALTHDHNALAVSQSQPEYDSIQL